MQLQLKNNFSDTLKLLFNGCNLMFVKLLNEQKQEIINLFPKIKKKEADTFLTQMKDFQKGNLNYLQRTEFILNVFQILATYSTMTFENVNLFLNLNLSKEYLFRNFDIWWFQSLYFMKEAGYIKNINEYCQKYLNVHENIYSDKEVQDILNKSYSMSNVPLIFSVEELKELKSIHRKKNAFFSHL